MNENHLFEEIQFELENLTKRIVDSVRNKTQTYGDAKRLLEVNKKTALWDGNDVLAKIIDKTIDHFEKEKDGLSLKEAVR